ncbi:hypothetical protein V8E36_000496 [Tilletia maclaganii]
MLSQPVRPRLPGTQPPPSPPSHPSTMSSSANLGLGILMNPLPPPRPGRRRAKVTSRNNSVIASPHNWSSAGKLHRASTGMSSDHDGLQRSSSNGPSSPSASERSFRTQAMPPGLQHRRGSSIESEQSIASSTELSKSLHRMFYVTTTGQQQHPPRHLSETQYRYSREPSAETCLLHPTNATAGGGGAGTDPAIWLTAAAAVRGSSSSRQTEALSPSAPPSLSASPRLRSSTPHEEEGNKTEEQPWSLTPNHTYTWSRPPMSPLPPLRPNNRRPSGVVAHVRRGGGASSSSASASAYPSPSASPRSGSSSSSRFPAFGGQQRQGMVSGGQSPMLLPSPSSLAPPSSDSSLSPAAAPRRQSTAANAESSHSDSNPSASTAKLRAPSPSKNGPVKKPSRPRLVLRPGTSTFGPGGTVFAFGEPRTPESSRGGGSSILREEGCPP